MTGAIDPPNRWRGRDVPRHDSRKEPDHNHQSKNDSHLTPQSEVCCGPPIPRTSPGWDHPSRAPRSFD